MCVCVHAAGGGSVGRSTLLRQCVRQRVRQGRIKDRNECTHTHTHETGRYENVGDLNFIRFLLLLVVCMGFGGEAEVWVGSRIKG